uniref:TSA: Wollemia nobilis Ref_Wollemi_Transcript_4876_3591 transcribed RNA sequence n=1 Tax=Wollemia nobilis TaxID=56998 RepID=A0A0C9RXX7_9CONI
MMDGRLDRALLLALAVGIAAGTAATVTSIGFPYAFGAAFNALQVRRKREQREQRNRLKSEKIKKAPGKPKESQIYREILQKALIDWKDIDVSLDNFPYYLSDNTKTALLDSVYTFLKRPEFIKYVSNLASVSPRILVTGPPGSEIYQETLVKGLGRYLQINVLVLDCTDVLLEAREMQPSNLQKTADQFPNVPLASSNMNGDVKSKDKSHIHASTLKSPDPITSPVNNCRKKIPDMGLRSVSEWSVVKQPDSDAEDKSMLVTVPSQPVVSGTTVDPPKRLFRKGDRVRYVGPSNGPTTPNLPVSSHRGSSGGKGPLVGSKGRVILLLEENPNKVGVRFDKPVYGGNNMVDLCEDGYGYFCNVLELRLEHSVGEDENKIMFDALIDILSGEASKEPLVLFIKDVERSMMGNLEHYKKLEQLDKAESRVVIIGSHTMDFQKDKGSFGTYSASKSGNSLAPLLDLPFLDNFMSRLEDIKGESSKSSRALFKLFPTRIYLQQPQDETVAMDWNQQIEQDMERLKAEANRQQLCMVMGSSGVICRDLAELEIKNHMLTHDMAEKVVGWAVSHHLQKDNEPIFYNGKLVITAESMQHSLTELLSVQRTSPTKKSLKDVTCDNEFEKILISEVIPPDELGVTFDSIGALENVKEALRELVMLPLQRPELFAKGQLRKPCRGLLLFGPPGTGKTMLAKAVATEAGANFINISMSTIASKWFGEAEKYVKAVFTLANKIAPSVIFIDEVDSMLGRRGKDSEHSAMRKLKNEFMASWDGLRTRDKERVLVLAATNRPFDLDEAVIRRFPRRLMVDLPDAENRAKILKVILVDEDLAPEFNMEELAAATDGYSGSDLKSLCTTAAYQRIRELLDQESKERERAKSEGQPPPLISKAPELRPISMGDVQKAMEKVRSSVSADARSILELRQWNEQYGEGGTRKVMTLSYFM